MDFGDISGFSPEEQAALNYHRANLINNRYLRHPGGGITTFMGSIGRTQDNKGEMYFPTYWGGAILEPRSAFKQAVKSGIKFPVYSDVETALKREQAMHNIMEQDTKLFLKSLKNAGKK